MLTRHFRFIYCLVLFGLALIVLFVGLAVQAPGVAAGPLDQVWYVKANAAGANNGTSWANAFTSLQSALTAAQSGDEIWVAAGVYTAGENRSDSFQLKKGVALYGGFAGNETAREQQDWQANVTVLSGDIDNNDGVDANGVVTDTANIVGANTIRVVVGSGTDATALLDGFTITGGDGNFGAGMHNTHGSPTLRHLVFSGNKASFGGGLYNNESSPALTQVTFIRNSANFGGGMDNLLSNPALSQVVFESNSGAFGGGMRNETANPTLTQVTFTDNKASFGAGMNNTNSSHPVLTHVRFVGNFASASGGGMNNGDFSSLQITNAIFSGNRAGSNGGGMENTDVPFITATNTIFSGNRAGSTGGGIRNLRTSLILQNSLLWNNRDSSISGVSESLNNGESTVTVRQSLVERCKPGGAWQSECGSDGGNNLTDADPLFISPVNPVNAPTTEGNLRVWADSPVINAGNNSFIAGVATDLDGNPRIVGGAADLGAYEAPINPPVRKVVYLPSLWR